jgi:N12 class adenine-specific DNA methylase
MTLLFPTTKPATSKWSSRTGKADLSGQLDFFAKLLSDAPEQAAVAQGAPPKPEVVDARANEAGADDSGALATALAANDGGPSETRAAGGSDTASRGTDRGPPLRTLVSSEDGISGGLGNSDHGIRVSGLPADEREQSAAAIAQDLDNATEQRPRRDFRITESHRIGHGGLHAKADANIAAIRTIKQLEVGDRDPTDDEKALLDRYCGWGAMPNVFAPWQPNEWKSAARELEQLLTPDEYQSARASTPNAHFTSPVVIAAIWNGLRRLGIRPGAQVLEPALGVGHFFGLMPEDLLAGSHRTGIELDSLTARIAKRLYPDSTIFAKGFEDTPLPDNFFNVIVGNVPFGDYPVHDPQYKRAQTRAIHDYFFAKSVDKLRPGGVLALITSRYTMDKQDATMRRYLAERADLVGAIRLPNTAFKGNAGTEVTADILFLQKREPGKKHGGRAWTEIASITADAGDILVNEYYARHPKMMLGTMAFEGSMYRAAEPTLTGELTPEMLAGAVAALPESVYIPRDEGRPPPAQPLTVAACSDVKDGAFAERNGELVFRCANAFQSANLPAAITARIRGMLVIRDAMRLTLQTQLEDAPEQRITEARHLLNRAYDSFVRSQGPISSRENIRAFAGDPDLPLLLSLENYDAETKRATKTAIFERRTLERYRPVERAETAAEALAISLNETGAISWPRMTELTGKRPVQLQRELDGLVYRNPEGAAWETADRYLSGDVRAKLLTAESAAALDPVYMGNVDALKAVQPADVEPGDISARLGASWIPKSDIGDFIAELLDIPAHNVKIGHADAIATWTVNLDTYAKSSVANTTTHGTARFYASDLIEQALNGRVPTAYDEQSDGTRTVNQQETIAGRERQQQIKDRFREWVWRDEERTARLARDYNDKFNNVRLRTFDGSHLTFPGICRQVLRDGDLSKHQKDAVWRIVQSPSTLLAHSVGAGKTWIMTAAAMEMRRLGLAKKPMIVVPNHLVEQWGAAFLQLYPHANILIAGKEHFSTGNRQRAMSRIATGNWDAVIVSHRSFEFLPVSDELFNRFINDQVAALEEAITEMRADRGDNRRLVKELEKAKKRLTAKLKDRADREGKDNTITFEELGVDQVFVDESDLYKNLSYVTKMNRIAGLPNSESNRALDMFIKTRYLFERNAGRGVVFATGTPIANTMAELYTVQRYLAPQMLKERGVEHFDAWAANFGEAVTSLELAPDGSGYRMHTRFAKFVNLPELLSMFRSFADVQTADMLKLPRPEIEGGKPQIEAAPASYVLKAFVQTLTKRAEAIRSGSVDPSIDNMLAPV